MTHYRSCPAERYLRVAVAPVLPSPRIEVLSEGIDETSLELVTAPPGVNRLVSEAEGTGGSDDLVPGCGVEQPTTATRAAAEHRIESVFMIGSVLLGVGPTSSKECTEALGLN
jgi:hypothetical protein